MDKNFFKNHKGIIFIKDGWAGDIDHIDLWNKISLRAGQNDYFSKGTEIWIWDII